MATVREYFETHRGLGPLIPWEVKKGDTPIEAIVGCVQDFPAGIKYRCLYIGPTDIPEAVTEYLLSKSDEFWAAEAELLITEELIGGTEQFRSDELKDTGRVFVYTPTEIEQARWSQLAAKLRAEGISLYIRDAAYARVREGHERPLAFLSHDSRDKHDFVRPLAQSLALMRCPIWYDEYTLVPGDSLRTSIEKGLKQAAKCVFVLSPNFFNNEGWGKREFETVYQREIIEGKRAMIPIWLGVSKKDVYDYSPILLDTLAIDGSIGPDEVATKLVAALNYEPRGRL